MRARAVYIGTGLVSMATLMLEIGLTRLFSATMYYHFAFLSISLALLGSGAGGIAVFLARRRAIDRMAPRLMTGAALLSAASAFAAVVVVVRNPLGLDAGWTTLARLALVCSASALPFFFAGSSVALAVAALPERIHRLYFFDLGGAAAGCLLLIPALDALGAVDALFLAATLAALAGAVFGLAPGGGRLACLAGLAVTVACACALAANARTGFIDVGVGKARVPGRLLFSKWNSFSRVTVEGDLQRDPMLLIVIDADAATSIQRAGLDDGSAASQRRHSEATAYLVRRADSVLILGPGGGNDLLRALACGAGRITAVEINPIIARDVMSSEPFRGYSGAIYERPNVRLLIDEGRTFIRGTRERYDVIQATMVDTWAATAAGAFALTENYLYTVEAFKDYAAHLTDDGILTVTRWYLDPPDQLLRLVALARAMMSELGIADPSRHLVVLREAGTGNWRVPGTVMFKKSRFTDDELGAIERIAEEGDLPILYTAHARPDNAFTRLIEAPDPATVWRSSPTDISPTRDDNPFFFNTVRLSHLSRVFEGPDEWRKTNVGTVVLLALLGVTFALLAALYGGPLLALRAGRPGAPAYRNPAGLPGLLPYFVLLGGAYMVVEIALVQEFILFLGRPVYSLAVVLFSLLVFSGIGGALSGRLPEAWLASGLRRLLPILAALVAVYAMLLPPVIHALVQTGRPTRIIVSVVLLAPPALLMGVPMPAGIRMLLRRAPSLIPWAWGLNGAASVCGSVGALVLALLLGLKIALLTGSALYLGATACLRRLAV